MKKITLILLFFFGIMALTQAQTVSNPTETAESVVNRQLDAYNARDIDGFVATYSEDIEIYKKGVLIMKGHEQLRESYSPFFENTPNLHCRIENRILISNKVIDKEYVVANERILESVAVYEVSDGKIRKVTFID